MLRIQLAVQQQGASVRAAASPTAAAAGARFASDAPSPPVSPMAAAGEASGAPMTAADRHAAEELASEAMRAVQAEDLGRAARLMGKAARLFPAEYGEAFDLIEAARASVGAEVEPDSPGPAASPSAASPAAAAGAAAAAQLSGAAPPDAAAASSAAPGSAHGTPSRKAARGGKARARTVSPEAAASASRCASPPRAAAPARSRSPDAGGNGAQAAAEADAPPEEAPEAQLPDWTWRMLAVALWHVWGAVLEEYLPLGAEAAGWAAGEAQLRAALQRDAPERSRIMVAATAGVALLLLAAGFLLLALVQLALGWAAAALSFTWKLCGALLRAVAWEPVWWAVLPVTLAGGVQSQSALVSRFWAAPFWWWLLGGRMWALLGSALAVGTLMLLGAVPYWLAITAWTLLRGACSFTSWWLRIPACLVVFAAWAFGFLLWLHALAAAARAEVPGELPSEVPAGAEGEVARILGCRNYYTVLELDNTADEEAVRKAHRRKGACVLSGRCTALTLTRLPTPQRFWCTPTSARGRMRSWPSSACRTRVRRCEVRRRLHVCTLPPPERV